VLFYKAHLSEHREKLRAIFPYVLGAVSAEAVAMRAEAETVKRELARKKREVEALEEASRRWLGELRNCSWRLVT
jgi:hypothetical protein